MEIEQKKGYQVYMFDAYFIDNDRFSVSNITFDKTIAERFVNKKNELIVENYRKEHPKRSNRTNEEILSSSYCYIEEIKIAENIEEMDLHSDSDEES